VRSANSAVDPFPFDPDAVDPVQLRASSMLHSGMLSSAQDAL